MSKASTSREYDEALGRTPRAEEAKMHGYCARNCAEAGFTINEIMFVAGCTYGTARTLKSVAKKEGFAVTDEMDNCGPPPKERPQTPQVDEHVIAGILSNGQIARMLDVPEFFVLERRSHLRAANPDVPASPGIIATRRPEWRQVFELLQDVTLSYETIAERTGTYQEYVASVARRTKDQRPPRVRGAAADAAVAGRRLKKTG